MARRIDRRIDRLPGLAGLGLIDGARREYATTGSLTHDAAHVGIGTDESTTYSRRRDPAMIRLRQVALVASDLDTVVAELCAALGLEVCFVDPGVGEFGLHNALDADRRPVPRGRLTDPRGHHGRPLARTASRDDGNGDGGYMAIYEVDDLDDARRARAGRRRTRRLVDRSPHDPGQAPAPTRRRRCAGVDRPARQARRVAVGRSDVACPRRQRRRHMRSPASRSAPPTRPRCAQRWAELGLDHAVQFVPATDRGEGIDGLDLVATDRDRAGETMELCGVAIRLV